MARAIDKRIMLNLIIEAKKTDPEAGPFSEWLAEYLVDHLPTLTHPNEPLTCEGCAEFGQWENEYEYGYPSPCTFCKRRACDNYRRPPEGEI